MAALLELIADWSNAAENEVMDREYFYESSHLKRILRDNRIVAIGRKGTGKTALATHIAGLNSKTLMSSGVKLASLDLPPADNTGSIFGNFEMLSKGWSKVILEAAADLVIGNLNVSPAERQQKRKSIGLAEQTTQTGFIDRVRQIKLSASFFGVEVGLNGASESNPVSIDQHNERLRGFIEENHWSSDKKIVIVFDGLDEGYVQAWQSHQEPAYFRTITALIAAAISEKNYFNRLPVRRQLLPVVFIRSDIFDRLHHQQKTAWQMDQGLRWRDEAGGDPAGYGARAGVGRVGVALRGNRLRVTERAPDLKEGGAVFNGEGRKAVPKVV